jgi:DNA-directed RNA polymerase specialized sigma24 family protein
MIADDGGKQVERITIMDARANHPGRSPEELHPLKLDVQSVIETLPPRLREIAEGLKTHSVTEIAQQHGMSRRHMHRLVNKIRQHFDEAGLRGYLR